MNARYFYLVVICCVLLYVPAGFAGTPQVNQAEIGQNKDAQTAKRAPIGLSGEELELQEEGKHENVKKRFILPPYISLKTRNTEFKTVLPFFYYSQRKGKAARKDVGLLPFYWSHESKDYQTKVYFPFYWRIHSPAFDTKIVLQSYLAKSKDAYHIGSAPFFFIGKNKEKQTSYQVILPPLFWNFKGKDHSLTYSLLYYNKKNKAEFHRGVVPFYFARKKYDKTITTVLPPLFWHISDPVNYKTTTVLPPFFFSTREKGWSLGLLPAFYFARDKNWSRNMVMPFYYGSRVNDEHSHYLPLLLSYWKRSKTLRQGGIAALYHWYRFKGEYMNMYTPLAWTWGNTRTLKKNILIPPFYYKGSSPIEDNTMIGMIYWNFQNHHLSKVLAIAPLFAVKKTTRDKGFRAWVFPTFDFGKNQDGYHARFHPLFYVGKHKKKKHLVLAPLFWQFEDEKEKSTVVFPLWWQFKNRQFKRVRRVVFPLWWQFDDHKYGEFNRVAFPFYWDIKRVEQKKRTILTFPPVYWKVQDANSARTGVLNVSLHKGKRKGHSFWTFNLFPLVLFGKPPAPDSARWEVLHGLVGWRRQGSTKELKLFWIPIGISD